MDFFNTKKLIEREREIQRLEKTIQDLKQALKSLKSQNELLKTEKDNEADLHREVVDKMLGEIQAFISANHDKELSYMSFETLSPLVEVVLKNHSFLLKIDIKHYIYNSLPFAHQKDLIVAHCEIIIDKLIDLQLVEAATVDEVQLRNSYDSFDPSVTYQIGTKFTIDDFRKRLILLNTNAFACKINDKTDLYFKDISATIDENQLIILLENRKFNTRGF